MTDSVTLTRPCWVPPNEGAYPSSCDPGAGADITVADIATGRATGSCTTSALATGADKTPTGAAITTSAAIANGSADAATTLVIATGATGGTVATNGTAAAPTSGTDTTAVLPRDLGGCCCNNSCAGGGGGLGPRCIVMDHGAAGAVPLATSHADGAFAPES
jgi:hypothetical protein